jgi:hypothetical protein
MFNIRVRAQDEKGVWSEWSDPLPVCMSRDKSIIKTLLNRFFEQYSLKIGMLQKIIKTYRK